MNRNDQVTTGTTVQDQQGRTPLCLAASGPLKSHSETVRFLLEVVADLKYKQRDGSTPLLLAAKVGNVQSMKYLLGEECSVPGNKGSDVNELNSARSSPLSLAVSEGHADAALLLLDDTRDVSKREDPRDSLSWAAGYGMMEVSKSFSSGLKFS